MRRIEFTAEGERPVIPFEPLRAQATGKAGLLLVEHHHCPPMEIEAHTLDSTHLVLRLSDPVELGWMESGRPSHKLLPRGAVSIYPPGEVSRAWWKAPSELLIVDLPSALLQQAMSCDELRNAEIGLHRGVVDPLLHALLFGLKEELENGGEGGPLYADSIAAAMTGLLLTRYSTRGEKPFTGGLAPTRLRSVRDYIHSNLGGTIRLADLAAHAGLSLSHFATAFRRATGKSPHHYVMLQRVELAKRLLAAGKLDLSAISRASGFASQSHLTRIFRKFTGCTPAQWQVAVRGQRSRNFPANL